MKKLIMCIVILFACVLSKLGAQDQDAAKKEPSTGSQVVNGAADKAEKPNTDCLVLITKDSADGKNNPFVSGLSSSVKRRHPNGIQLSVRYDQPQANLQRLAAEVIEGLTSSPTARINHFSWLNLDSPTQQAYIQKVGRPIPFSGWAGVFEKIEATPDGWIADIRVGAIHDLRLFSASYIVETYEYAKGKLFFRGAKPSQVKFDLMQVL